MIIACQWLHRMEYLTERMRKAFDLNLNSMKTF